MIQDDNLQKFGVDSAAVSTYVVIMVELTNTVFVNSTNITTNIETAVLSSAGPRLQALRPGFGIAPLLRTVPFHAILPSPDQAPKAHHVQAL